MCYNLVYVEIFPKFIGLFLVLFKQFSSDKNIRVYPNMLCFRISLVNKFMLFAGLVFLTGRDS